MGFPCVRRDGEILKVLTFLSGLIIIHFQKGSGLGEKPQGAACRSRRGACPRGLRWHRRDLRGDCEPAVLAARGDW